MDVPDYSSRFLLNLTPQEFEDAKDAELADRVAKYFTPSPRLAYAGIAGIGAHGGALLFRETRQEIGSSKRIIVKYSKDESADELLRREATCLALMMGAEHIVQMVSLPQTQLDVTVLRSCVAMAYPPSAGPNTPPIRELIKDGPGSGMIHGSPHLGNIAFGTLSSDAEHGYMPVVKLIDFGRGHVHEDPAWANFVNMSGVASMIIRLALPSTNENLLRVSGDGPPIQYGLLGGQVIETYAPLVFLSTNKIDIVLRDFIARLLSENHTMPLELALHSTAEAVIERQVADVVNPAYSAEDQAMETDFGLRRIIEHCFLLADQGDVPSGVIRETTDCQLGTTMLGLLAMQHPTWKIPPDFSRKARKREKTLYEGFVETIERMRATNEDDVD
ncbi:hypothetical protein GGS26DRAFT_596148 [Hypomontagnella submonticulosa]|nr:hypothetical protein GGS26DRAFT_596148 [Hypomontagnella submonticulosa]